MGECLLREKGNAQIVAECLLHGHKNLYDLDSFVIMPNHVHILVRLKDTPLEKLMQAWKSVTSHRINKRLNKSGAFWQAKYWDTLIRNQRHFFKVRNYIQNNPTKAKLSPQDFILWIK
ncbi:transposase [Verrucomicrobiaceae bacterium 227]